MNWLIWIGGGIVFLAISSNILGIRRKDDSVETLIGVIIGMICLIMVWIWICWKFIR